jgi:hypothetical protein
MVLKYCEGFAVQLFSRFHSELFELASDLECSGARATINNATTLF